MAAKYMHVRITPGDTPDVYDRMMSVVRGDYGGGYVAVREYSDEGVEHFHVLVSLVGTERQFRNAVQRAFQGHAGGNKYYSTKICDVKMLQYVCKGDSKHPAPRGLPPDVVSRQGLYFTEERIREAYEAYWAESKSIKETAETTFPTRVEAYMRMNQIAFRPYDTVKAVIELTLKEKKVVNEFYCEGVAKFIMCKNDIGYKRSLIQRIADKIDNGLSQE